jgi:protease-4
MAADEIFANRNCLCVNIGVYISTYNLSELFENYGIEQVMIRSSDNKGIGSVGIPWTEEQLAIYQSIVDLYYDQFLDVVAAGRGMTKTQVKTLDDGREMLASQALEAGFIDGIARYEEYETQVLGYYDGSVTLYQEEPSSGSLVTELLQNLYGAAQSLLPKSDGELLQDFVSQQEGIVVMAYAG